MCQVQIPLIGALRTLQLTGPNKDEKHNFGTCNVAFFSCEVLLNFSGFCESYSEFLPLPVLPGRPGVVKIGHFGTVQRWRRGAHGAGGGRCQEHKDSPSSLIYRRRLTFTLITSHLTVVVILAYILSDKSAIQSGIAIGQMELDISSFMLKCARHHRFCAEIFFVAPCRRR